MVHLVADLAKAGATVTHPLLEERKDVKNVVLLVLTANRGMCGGYNSGILRLAQNRYRELSEQYPSVKLHVSGKRGISYMKYRKIEMEKSYTHFDYKPTFDEVDVLARDFLEDFQTGEIDRLEVVYCRFISASRQTPSVETLLPFSEIKADMDGGSGDLESQGTVSYEFLPSPQSILEEVVPGAFKSKLFKCFLDAAVCEQIARRVAMKSATENADSMINLLTTTYNRARQTQITNEILEVISGANALK